MRSMSLGLRCGDFPRAGRFRITARFRTVSPYACKTIVRPGRVIYKPLLMPLVLATRSSARWVEEIPLGGEAEPATHRPARFSFRLNAHSLRAKTTLVLRTNLPQWVGSVRCSNVPTSRNGCRRPAPDGSAGESGSNQAKLALQRLSSGRT